MANLAFNIKPQVIAPSTLITILWGQHSSLKAHWISLAGDQSANPGGGENVLLFFQL